MSCVARKKFHPERIEFVKHLTEQGMTQAQAFQKAAEHFNLSPATLKWELSYYSQYVRKHSSAEQGHYRKKHPAYKHIKTPYKGEIFQLDRWAFADQVRRMHDEGMCLEALGKHFKISSKAIAEYIELSKVFPENLRYKFFPTTLYRMLLKFDDPTKALEIAVRLKKEAPDDLYLCLRYHRKPSNGKIPVKWLEEKASKVLNSGQQPETFRDTGPVGSPVDLEWIRELQKRVELLEKELASARKLNFIYLRSLERANKLRRVFQN